MLERFNTAGRSFGQCLNTPISAVAYITNHLMPRRCSLREESIPDALHLTSNKKLSRDSLHVPQPTYT
jgi:hypothetical protein